LGNYQLLNTFPGLNSGTEIPDKISKLLTDYEAADKHIGAFGPAE
jgi:hypothetical protein